MADYIVRPSIRPSLFPYVYACMSSEQPFLCTIFPLNWSWKGRSEQADNLLQNKNLKTAEKDLVFSLQFVAAAVWCIKNVMLLQVLIPRSTQKNAVHPLSSFQKNLSFHVFKSDTEKSMSDRWRGREIDISLIYVVS